MTVPVAVFDCMVYLQAATRPEGPARACLGMVQEGRVVLSISPAIRAEVEDVLSRPKVRQKFPSLTPEAVAVFLGDIDALATSAAEVPRVVTLPRDPKDEPYLNLAVAAGAKRLVTWDKDLLDLMADHPAGTDFRNRFPGLVILTPVAFLRELAQAPAPSPGGDESGEKAKSDN
jgi:putative PIN family toxin of toxin-antitoxin system